MADAEGARLERAARADPTDHLACDRLALHLSEVVGDPAGAITWLEESFARHPSGWPLERIAGILSDTLGKPAKALPWLTRAAQIGPHGYWACDRIAEIFRDRLDDPQQAIAWFERSSALNPVPWPVERIAEIHRDLLHDPESAVAWFRKAAERAADNYWACERIAEIFHDQLGDPEQAIAWLEESLARRPHAWPCERIAEIYAERLADLPQANAWWRRAAEIDPSSSLACDRLADLHHYGFEDYQEAIRWYRQSAERRPRAEPLVRIGDMYRDHFADYRQAAHWFLEATHLDPDDPVACARLGELHLDVLGEPATALTWFEASHHRHPSVWACQRIADIHFEHLGDPEQSARWIAAALVAPDMPGQIPPAATSPDAQARRALRSAAVEDDLTCRQIDEHRSIVAPWDLLVEHDDQGPCFVSRRGPAPQRTFVISVPKSGTHLVNELLVEMGMVSCGVHFAALYVTDHRDAPPLMSRHYPGYLDRPCPLSISLQMIRQGQFGYGHVECTSRNVDVLRAFRKVLVQRNLREVVISAMRYLAELRKDEPMSRLLRAAPPAERLHRYLDVCGHSDLALWRAIARWGERDDVLTLRYETLVGDEGRPRQLEQLAALARWLDVPCPADGIAAVLDRSLGKATATWSGRRSAWREGWSDSLERLFVAMGLAELNRRLGYD